jgi:hypothetical protein
VRNVGVVRHLLQQRTGADVNARSLRFIHEHDRSAFRRRARLDRTTERAESVKRE